MTIASVEGWYLEVEGRRIDLREGEVTIGRSRGCGVVLRDPSVSRGHALMSVQAGRVTLQDLRSSNGSYVNGARLGAETPLAEGDRVVIGETALYLRRARPGAAQAAVPSEGAAFCPSCGRPIDGAAPACPRCGAELGAARLPRRSEAVGLGEVLPVGEVLGVGSASWEQTTFRQGAGAALAGAPPTAAGAPPPLGAQAAARESHSTSSSPASPASPSPPTRASVSAPPAVPASVAGAADLAAPSTAEPPALAELPMSVRKAEQTPSGPLPPLHPPPPTTGLLQRLAERLGLGRRA